MPIRPLPLLLVNQIAAGEVIERPASVVKELVENSLDAGATRIDVAVEDGGRQLIRISDDGQGIPADELPLALAPHATSKLQTAEQLAAIGTLGFRGEALASIASVSRLRLTSRARINGKPADEAAMIESIGGETSGVAPTAGAPGTVIEIRDLFFNTPARRKFLRQGPTEMAHVTEAVTRIAMVHPAVAFRLSHNGRTTLDLEPAATPAQRCIDLLGGELTEGLLEFSHELPHNIAHAGVWGLAGAPSLARATAKFIHLYVNGRPIRDRNLQHAVKEAYRGLMPMDKFPLAVVMLDIDPGEVDVNVHPAKAEVRFREPSRAHGLVLTAVRQKLLGSDLTPSVGGEELPGGYGVQGTGYGGSNAPQGSGASASPYPVPRTPYPVAGTARRPSPADHRFAEFFQRGNPLQGTLDLPALREAMREDASVEPAAPTVQPPALPGGTPEDPGSASPPAPAGNVLQVHDSYLVTQDEEGIVIIDQHALHERVMFEQLKQRVLGDGGRNLEAQRLLMPEVLDVPARAMALLEDLTPLLTRIGIEAEPIGPRQIAVQAFPTFLFDRGVEPGDFLRDLFDQADEGTLELEGPSAQESALHRVLDMMACKAAVKAGDHMSPAELDALLAMREQIERSSNCPHGRPTAIRLTLRDLEKHFKRT